MIEINNITEEPVKDLLDEAIDILIDIKDSFILKGTEYDIQINNFLNLVDEKNEVIYGEEIIDE